MQKANSRTYWKDFPSIDTQIDADILNEKDIAIDTIDDRVIHLDITKLDKVDAQGLIKSLTFNRNNGVFTITYFNGATDTIDTMLEKLAVNYDFDTDTQKLIIRLDDGTEKMVDLSAFITDYEFLDSGTVAFTAYSSGKVTANVKECSIEEKHLQPNYLADIKVEVAKAEASKTAAAESETNAKASENAAKESEAAAKDSEANASASATAAEGSANTASAKSAEAEESATEAATHANNASDSASTATNKADSAAESETNAANNAIAAAGSATIAGTKAEEALDYADLSKSYAVGTGGEVREDDDVDNAQYYYEQAKRVIQGVSGIVPMGTISFEGLSDSNNQKQGYMFNISDSFVSDERFQDGGGIFYGAGNNVLYTADGKWDVLAGAMVSGVKGEKEAEYRQGFVNLTAENVGALPEDGTAQNSEKWNGKSMVFISEDEYQTLVEKDENTVYFRHKEQ